MWVYMEMKVWMWDMGGEIELQTVVDMRYIFFEIEGHLSNFSRPQNVKTVWTLKLSAKYLCCSIHSALTLHQCLTACSLGCSLHFIMLAHITFSSPHLEGVL